MSNKTQILCNNNILHYRSLQQCWKQINSHLDTLIDLNTKKKSLIEEIVALRKENKNTAIQMIKLGRIIKEISFYKLMNQIAFSWIKDNRNKLVIC